MALATRMRMLTVMGMPMTICTGTYTIGKHATRSDRLTQSLTSLLERQVTLKTGDAGDIITANFWIFRQILG